MKVPMRINVEDRIPKYLKIYEYVHGMISRSKIRPGEKLPTETELAHQFGVNRMTVRKALDKLVVEEMIVRRRGQGTFLIAATPREFVYSLDVTTGFFKDMHNYGLIPRARTKQITVVEATPRIAAQLNLNHDKRVICMLRVFYADAEAIMTEKTYMPYEEFKDLLHMPPEGRRYPVLKQKYNIAPHHSNQTFTAVLAGEDEMRLFGFSGPQACIELECTVFDASDVPIEVGYFIFRGDKYRFNINAIEYLVDD